MPGIFGLSNKFNLADKFVREAVSELSYTPDYIFDSLYQDDSIICQRTHLGAIGEKKSPQIIGDSFFCWVEGEIYNQNILKQEFNFKATSVGNLLLEAYTTGKVSELLKKIDGCFVAIIYDKEKQIIQFITDRFGLKPLYIWQAKNNFAWSSELKGFFKLPIFEKKINPLAVECFLDCGQLIGDISWFKNVHLLPASTISKYNLKNNTYQKERYWNWLEINPQSVSFKEAIFSAGDLLKKAVNKRCHQSKISVSLSGGLDSRAIVGALDSGDNIHAITFGKKNTDECRFASEVAKVKGIPHTLFYIDGNNWFKQRMEGIWRVEGAISIQHLHASVFHEDMARIAQVSLNGFAGDLILGGSWTNNPDHRVSKEVAQSYFGKHTKLQPMDIPFYQLNKEDPYFIDTRVRRFTNMGIEEAGKLLEHRRPFMDIDLINFVYSLPDHYRLNYKLYFAIFKYCFSEKFSSIPWANTGLPLNRKKYYYHLWKRNLNRVQRKFGLKNKIEYTDYSRWINQYLNLFKRITNPKIALYPEYVNQSRIKHLSSLFNDKNKVDETMILRLVTLEIWLQQIFNNQYKDMESFLRAKKSD